jgi:hypothetical protein
MRSRRQARRTSVPFLLFSQPRKPVRVHVAPPRPFLGLTHSPRFTIRLPLPCQQAWSLENGQITQLVLHPTRDFGLPCHPLTAVKGLSSIENALLLNALLEPSSSSPVEPPEGTLAAGANVGAITDFILLNTAAVLLVSGLAPSLPEGVMMARESMRGGGAKRALEAFRVKAGEAIAQAGTA